MEGTFAMEERLVLNGAYQNCLNFKLHSPT